MRLAADLQSLVSFALQPAIGAITDSSALFLFFARTSFTANFLHHSLF